MDQLAEAIAAEVGASMGSPLTGGAAKKRGGKKKKTTKKSKSKSGGKKSKSRSGRKSGGKSKSRSGGKKSGRKSAHKETWAEATAEAYADHPRSKVPLKKNKTVYEETVNLYESNGKDHSPVPGGKKKAKKASKKPKSRSGGRKGPKSGKSAKSGKSRKSGGKKKDGVKRAPSAYIKFSNAHRADVIKKNPELKSQMTEVAKILGGMWRELSETQKNKWRA